MSAADWINLSSAVFAGIAVLLPSVLFIGTAFTRLCEWYRLIFVGKAYELL